MPELNRRPGRKPVVETFPIGRDIVLTWPKSTDLKTYLSVLGRAHEQGLVINYRVASPPIIEEGEVERVYMVHDGKIRGWNPFEAVEYRGAGEVQQARGGGYWPEGWYIVRKPLWHPLPDDKLITMLGFQGFRYIERERD